MLIKNDDAKTREGIIFEELVCKLYAHIAGVSLLDRYEQLISQSQPQIKTTRKIIVRHYPGGFMD